MELIRDPGGVWFFETVLSGCAWRKLTPASLDPQNSMNTLFSYSVHQECSVKKSSIPIRVYYVAVLETASGAQA